MTADAESMKDFFQAVVNPEALSSDPRLAIYQHQIRHRLLSVPCEVFLHRLQNIWGHELLAHLLLDYFYEQPPQGHRWNHILQGLPAFIEGHPDYRRILGLGDMCRFALKLWDCIHSENRAAEHFPADPIDLYELWNCSAMQQHGDPSAFWNGIARTGPRGCTFTKITAEVSQFAPLIRE